MMFDSLFRLWRRERLARSGKARPTTQPHLETLEVRWVPSTVTDNLTPSATLPVISTPPAATAAPAPVSTLMPMAATTATDPTTSSVNAAVIPPQITPPLIAPSAAPSATTQWTTSTTVNAVPFSTPTLPSSLNVGPPVLTTPAPVNPTTTGTPISTPFVTVPSAPATQTQTQGQGQNTSTAPCTTPSITPTTPTTTNGSTTTNSSGQIVTIPEYYGGTTTNSTGLPPTIMTPPVVPGSPSSSTGTGLVIGGTVYEDRNNNGLLETGEMGIANNQIVLENSAGNAIATTTTDANGHYQFTTDQTVSTSPQTQSQRVTFGMAPTNYTQTQAVQQFNPALGTLNSVQIIEQGQLTSDIKVENLDSSASQVTGTVSGQLNLSAPGVSNLTLNPTGTETNTLGAFDGHVDFAGTSGYDFGAQTAQQTQMATLSGTNTNLSAWIGTGQVSLTQNAQATSSANGPGNVLSQISSAAGASVQVIYNYTPTNSLQPGTYTVVQPHVPPGYTNGKDTGDNHTPFPANGPPNTIPVTITTGSSTNNNFGELKPSTLSGLVYLDRQHDGKFDTGDPIMPGVTVQLTNSQGTAVGTPQVTASDGSYSFVNLAPGTYTLTVVAPQGYVSSGADAGNLGSTTAPTNSTITVLVPENAQGTNYDFGLVQAPTTPPPSGSPGTPIPGPPSTTPTPSTPSGPGAVPGPSSPPSTGGPGIPFSKRMFIGANWGALVNQ